MNTIRELKQQEKYKSMLKRKNKEKKIYKDKNASLQFEKQKLYRALLNREKEIERLNNIINELNNAYCKVITKCEEMIDSRFYMNDIAIKKYADEIKDICKYYVGEAKELKGDDKE